MYTSVNQTIGIRYGAQVESSGVNEKIKDIFGSKAILEGFNVVPKTGRTCTLETGKAIIDGATIAEGVSIDITFPSPSGTKSYYIYAIYSHGENAQCTYDILTAETGAANYLLLSVVTFSESDATILEEHIENEAHSSGLKDAVVFIDKNGKIIEDVFGITIGGVMIGYGGSGVYPDFEPTGTDHVFVDGYMTAKALFNPNLSDFAEYFFKGEDLEPGHVVSLDLYADKEQYVMADARHNNATVGVVSTEPAHVIGGDPANIEDYAPVALSGRIPTKVVGKVKRGQYLVLSDIPGVAMAKKWYHIKSKKQYIGMAVRDKLSNGIDFVECFVGKV